MIEVKTFILTGSEAFLLAPIIQWSVLTEEDGSLAEKRIATKPELERKIVPPSKRVSGVRRAAKVQDAFLQFFTWDLQTRAFTRSR